jgi:tetratricopeptide (TPR) repeat protein
MENQTLEKDLIDQLQEFTMAHSTLEVDRQDKAIAFHGDHEQIIGQGYYRLAKVFYDKADLPKATDYFLKALSKCKYPQDAFAYLKIYGFMIRIHSEGQQEEEAQKYISLAQDLVDRLGSDLGSLNAEYFFNVGMVSNYKGDQKEAFDNFEMAYKHAQKENEPEMMAKSLFSMANVTYQMHKFEEALVLLDQLRDLLEILNKGYLKGTMSILYGNVYKELGMLDEAMLAFDRAIIALQKKNCWNLYCYILLGKGIVLKKKGEFNQALVFFELAKNSVDRRYFKRLADSIQSQVEDVTDSSIDIYLDRHNRVVNEKDLGIIDFKHRFVLLEILFLLAKNSGEYYTKEDLASLIWKDEYNPLIHDKLIYTSVSRLRKLIEPTGNGRKYILRGKDGYTFNPRINARFHREDEKVSAKSIGNIEITSPV